VDVNQFIRQTLDAGRSVLNEAESKQILKQYGVPVVSEAIVATAEEAVRVATDAGFPVVLKGIGEQTLHKTECGLVYIRRNRIRRKSA
jgi:acyl-CoA synthetase (NDP forming)